MRHLLPIRNLYRLRRSTLARHARHSLQSFTTTYHSSARQIPHWNTSCAILLSVVVGSLAYGVGTKGFGLAKQVDEFQQPRNKPVYAKKADLETAIAEIAALIGEDAITCDDDEVRRHGYSEWSSINIDRLPVAIAYPKSTEEVSAIAKLCTKYKIPMVPYSGGSSLEGNFSAPYGGICLDFAFMDKIIAVHEDDLDVVVQPAIGWMQLNDKIKDSGLFFPVDPGPSAMIGGMVGTSCSGTNAARYGTMKENVVNLTVVLADGTILKTKRRPRKSAAGYNLTGMFIGSEGTLGMVTEITLKLSVIPQETSVAVVTFPTIRDAAAATSQIIKAGIPVGAMELMDEVSMSVVNKSGGTNRKWKEVPTMFFKFSGTKSGVLDSIGLVEKIATSCNGGEFDFAVDSEEQKSLWSARKGALWSMLALRKSGEEVWSTDVAVPMSRLPDIIEVSKKEMDDLGLFASVLGHVGDGNFHESIMYNKADPEERQRVEQCVARMVERALEMDGTCTGEHGIGIGKKSLLVQELGLDAIGIMQKIKQALDPHWIMNPGKVFDHHTEDKPVGH